MNAPTVTAPLARPPVWRRAFDWWFAQVLHMLPAVIFFFIGFNLILFTRWMTLEEHGIPFTNFFGATFAALLIGKVVLVVDNLPFMRRFDGAPLIQPILFKTAIYWVCVFVFRITEGLIHFLIEGGALADFPTYLAAKFSWPRFLAIQLWLMVLFLIYVVTHELNALFGDGELYRLFFRWRTTVTKLTRRQRIRALVRLSRITDAHTVTELRDPTNPAHAEVIAIVEALSNRDPAASVPKR